MFPPLSPIFLHALLAGVVLGCIYALISLGFSIFWGTSDVVHIALPSIALISSYLTYFGHMLLNLPFPILLISSILTGLFINWAIVEVIKGRLVKMTPLTTLLIFFGMVFIFEGIMSYIWGVRQRTLIIPYLESMIGVLPLKDILIISLTLLVYLILIFFFSRVKQGIAIKAAAQNRKGALICGISTFTIYRLISLIGGAACGLAGSLLAVVYSFYPAMGTVWIAYLFFVVVIGGKGSILGSLVGGLVLGILQSLIGAMIPLQWTEFILFLGLVLILVVRPQGLFGG